MPEGPVILVVDDEEQILRVLRPTLEAHGYVVETASNGAEALAILQRQRVSAIILDLGLPDMDGKEVIQRAGELTSAPVLVLSARDADSEKIAALDAGAEDYVGKPFSVGELLARVRVLLRSNRSPINGHTYTVGEAVFDFRSRTVNVDGHQVRLSARETTFLRLLAERNGEVVSHREIILAVWGDLHRADAQFVRVLAGQVRNKIEADPSAPALLVTVPGVGYQLGQ
jgi:two-component system, OmpR family, KDP operon response regulator KdpE